ncbi:hypothetical protein CEXT_265361 [Caerostris extrusa]|uniref:Uncharacterized protein n=1 Tax=Caerostris extrusa TaxID=172846 RepID=A0AAV4V4E8_CAEEX|nr:hypothetical protein CEXT_265361 [Caerostris extrusa]
MPLKQIFTEGLFPYQRGKEGSFRNLTGPEKKIAELEDNMAVMRMEFKLLKAEVRACDRYKEKKARKKVSSPLAKMVSVQ